MAAIARYLNDLFPFFDEVYVNMTFIAILRQLWLHSHSLFSYNCEFYIVIGFAIEFHI